MSIKNAGLTEIQPLDLIDTIPKISTNPQKVLNRERPREAPQHQYSENLQTKIADSTGQT